MSGITAVSYFLISLVFSLVISTLWLRIALRYFKISHLNVFSQLIYSVTNPIVNPVNILLRLKPKPHIAFDWTAFGVLILIEAIKILLLGLLTYQILIPIIYLVIFVIADLIIQPCDLLFYAILIRVVLSYVNPGLVHPILDFLRVVTEPLLKLGRRVVPDISGFDFSPFIMMVILKIISLFITYSLPLRLL